MGWATNLFCDITFYKQTYNSKYEVESKIEELNESIKYNEEYLKKLAFITEPGKFFNNEENVFFAIDSAVREALEILEEDYIEKYKLTLLLDNWDMCHTKEGLAIDPPDNIGYDTAYLSGDFIKSVKYPNE